MLIEDKISEMQQNNKNLKRKTKHGNCNIRVLGPD